MERENDRRPTRGGYTRQRRGCATCRRRKKKCDQVYPVCGHCSRLNLVCQRETPRVVQAAPELVAGRIDALQDAQGFCCHPSYQELKRHANVQNISIFWQPPNQDDGVDLIASRRSMLRYYTATLAIMLTTNLGNNCFLSVLMPMAFECQSLMYALAAWSSVHLALGDERFQQISLKHRGLALAQLKTLIKDQTLSPEMSLAVTLVLCSMESIADGTGSWYHHLSGAAAVLGWKCSSTAVPLGPADSCSRSLEGRWLLRNFAYHDILMSVSMDRRPFIDGDYWLCEDDKAADPYFGFASRILQLIGQTSSLNADFLARDELGANGSAGSHKGSLSQRARLIEEQVKGWICPSDGSDDPLAVLGEAYRTAALIHLYRTLHRHVGAFKGVLREKIGICVSAMCELATKMPEGALAECTFLFPLFLAGGEAEKTDEIEIIRDRLVMMNKWRKFRNVGACLDVLDEVWRLRAEGARSTDEMTVDWLDVLRHRNWHLAIT